MKDEKSAVVVIEVDKGAAVKPSAEQADKHEAVCCPRCCSDFACKPGSITLCHCFDVKLSPEQQEWIAERWQGCLCGACLRELIERDT